MVKKRADTLREEPPSVKAKQLRQGIAFAPFSRHDAPRMGNRKTIFGIAVAVAVLLFLAAAIVALLPNPTADDIVKVSCLNTTNDPLTGLTAILSVTNQGDADIYLMRYAPQTKTGGVWSVFTLYVSGSVMPPISTLSAHTSGTFQVHLMGTGDAWRVPVSWSSTKANPVIFIQKEFEINVYRNFQRLGRGEMPVFYGVPSHQHYMVFSPAVTNW